MIDDQIHKNIIVVAVLGFKMLFVDFVRGTTKGKKPLCIWLEFVAWV
jgi:hypothetical protein